MSIYKYIFAKAYYLCLYVIKEREFPQVFASGTTTLFLVTTLIVILESIEYVMLPTRFNTFGRYHGYFALLVFFSMIIMVNRNKYYLAILKQYEEIPPEKKAVLQIVSWVYGIVLVFSFFYLGYLLRQYNMQHR